MEIRLTEVPLAAQLRGLRDGIFDAGFARYADAGDGVEAYPVWREQLSVAIPARHPLLAHRLVELEELARYPLVMCHPELCEGYRRQVERILRATSIDPIIAERATSLEMMMTLVAAGYGVGFVAAEHVAVCRHPDIVYRPLALEAAEMTTFLLARTTPEPSAQLAAFIKRALRDSGESDQE